MISAEAKLALTELLLSSVDASVCAQKGLEWLGRHAGVGRALLATAASDPGRLWGIAALGISPARTGEFVLDLDDRRDPLVAVAWSGTAARTSVAGRDSPKRRSRACPFYAVPLRPDRTLPPLGMLLLESDEPELDDDVAVVRRDPRREVPGSAAAQRHRRSRHRPRAASALQHHQRGHRPDSADRRHRAS